MGEFRVAVDASDNDAQKRLGTGYFFADVK